MPNTGYSYFDAYELGRIVSRSNGVNSMKEYQLRDIKHRITRDFKKSIDAENVLINDEERLVLITRDKGDEQIKKIKSLPDERFDLGDIVNWNGTNYIIYKMDADRRIQSKGRMYECNTKLRWKNKKGVIIERVGKGEDATKYGEGTEGTFRMRIGEFQLKVIVRLDEETVLIKRDDRFIIDADPIFYPYDGETTEDVNNYVLNGITPNVYRVTRRNVTTGTFPNIGYVELTFVEDHFVDGQDDVVNMIDPSVSEMVKIPTDSSASETSGGISGNEGNEVSGDDNNSEGGWL